MSFVNKIRGWGQKGAASEHDALEHDAAFADAYANAAAADGVAAGGLPLSDIEASAAFDVHAVAAGEAVSPSIIAEAVPSGIADFTETRLQGADSGLAPLGAGLPLIGRRPVPEQQRILLALLGIGLVGVIVLTIYSFASASRGAAQVAASGQAMMESQRLAKSVSQALVGSAAAFPELKESSEVLASNVRGLKSGDGSVAQAPAAVQDALDAVVPLVDRAEKNAAVVIAQQKALTAVGEALRGINRQSSGLLEASEAILSLKLQRDSTPIEVSALGQLVMLTQRIGKSANEFLTGEGVNPEAVFLLGKDLNAFSDISKALLDGNPQMGLAGSRDPQIRERLIALAKQYQETRSQGSVILDNLAGLSAAREAQHSIITDSEPLRKNLDTVQDKLSSGTGFGGLTAFMLFTSVVLLLVGGAGVLRLYVTEQGQRASLAQQRRVEAETQEQEAKRVNDANQAAILRLMNELQGVAEGDLTQQATVTEDITGAIADSVNYTVEELRTLVSQVQGTVTRVAATTEQVEANSSELLATSSEQLREIRDTGESVLQMAGRINHVSAQAQETAQVARQSLQAAESGLQAVQNTIGGMNSIRDHIQETSKRIKRLG
ncbi:MAG: methyl-accepting chemotaxis protein, partial [Pseudomonadota bacterium]|nr:methyl-accepting chemotaxis protein [Pseudomonadota bacterium]